MSKGVLYVEDGEVFIEKYCFYIYMCDRGGQSDILDMEVIVQIKCLVVNGIKRL